MSNGYSLSGTKIVVRRLFKQDIDLIIDMYKEYDRLHHNPMNPVFANEILLHGEFWGAFHNEHIIGCAYFFPLESDFFKGYETFTALTDFIENPNEFMYLGYVATDKNYATKGLYQVFYNIVEMQAFRQGMRYILHGIPVKMSDSIEAIFNSQYKLIKMRGLDNLVVHYIFAKPIYAADTIFAVKSNSIVQMVCLGNTKALSKYLEHGYCGVDIISEKDGAILQLKELNS